MGEELIPLKEKKKKCFKVWHEAHKDDYNEARRIRYENDPDYRARIQKQSRENKRKRIASQHGAVYRYWHGIKLLVHRVGALCDHLGIDPYTLRTLEKDGIVPKPIFQGQQRVYTQNQADLLIMLCASLLEVKHDPKKLEATRQKMKVVLKARWEDI